MSSGLAVVNAEHGVPGSIFRSGSVFPGISRRYAVWICAEFMTKGSPLITWNLNITGKMWA